MICDIENYKCKKPGTPRNKQIAFMNEVMRNHLCFIITRSILVSETADSTLDLNNDYIKFFSISDLSNSRERGAL